MEKQSKHVEASERRIILQIKSHPENEYLFLGTAGGAQHPYLFRVIIQWFENTIMWCRNTFF